MHGDVKMVASCRVKPYQLIDRNTIKDKSSEDAERQKVMLEDGLRDVNELKNDNTDTLEDEEKDSIGAKYLKVINSDSLLDIAIYTMEHHVSEHGRPEVEEAKIS